MLLINKPLPIEALDLPLRVENALKRIGVRSVEDLLAAGRDGLYGLRGVGKKLRVESLDAVSQFLKKNDQSPLTDALNEFLSQPSAPNGGTRRKVLFEEYGNNLPRAFPEIVSAFVSRARAKTAKRDEDILSKRFGLRDGKKYTLEELGTYYGVSRERIRQIESRILRTLRGALNGNNAPRSDRGISQLLVSSFNSIVSTFQSSDYLLLDSEVSTIVTDYFAADIPSGYRALFMELCGYQEFLSSIPHFRGKLKKAWCQADQFHMREVAQLFVALDGIYESPDPKNIFDVAVQAKRKNKRISNESIHIVIKSCADIELDDDVVRLKFSALRNHADRAYRVLAHAKEPLHYGEIVRQINRQLGNAKQTRFATNRSVAAQMGADERFTPIAKSGIWTLSSWNIANITILDALQMILHRNGKPLRLNEIRTAMQDIRPDASDRSLKVYLYNSPTKIVSLDGGKFALASWGLLDTKPRTPHQRISKVAFRTQVHSVFGDMNEMPLSALVSAIKQKTGQADATVRQRINSVEYLSVIASASPRTVKYNREAPFETDNADRVLLRDKVQTEILSILKSRPNEPVTKGALYQEVAKTVPCIKPTFYTYLSRISIDGVRQYRRSGKFWVVYEHTEPEERIAIDNGLVKSVRESELRANLVRAIQLLTLETVDLGLLELGRTLETVLKRYLLEAQRIGAVDVHRRDLRNFASMIECISREKVIPRSYQLSVLREERNARAHGGVLSPEGRRSLYNSAHYLAELFVQHIALFAQKYDEIGGVEI